MQFVSTNKNGGPRKRLAWTAIVCFAALALIVVYGSFNPESGYFPRCTIKALTGLDCPGCGSQRAFHALLNGRVAEAWHYNGFMLAMLPVIACVGAADMLRNRYPRFHRAVSRPAVAALLLVAIILWTILRNL